MSRRDDEITQRSRGRRAITDIRGTRIDDVPVVSVHTEAVPDHCDDSDDHTPVFHLIDEDDAASNRRMRENFEQVVDWVRGIRKRLSEQSDSDREAMVELRKLLEQPPPQHVASLKITIDRIDSEMAGFRNIKKWLAGSAIAIISALFVFVYTRGGIDTSTQLRLEQLEKRLDRIERVLERDDRHSDVTPVSQVDAVSFATGQGPIP